jgi:hypothetical protein
MISLRIRTTLHEVRNFLIALTKPPALSNVMLLNAGYLPKKPLHRESTPFSSGSILSSLSVRQRAYIHGRKLRVTVRV